MNIRSQGGGGGRRRRRERETKGVIPDPADCVSSFLGARAAKGLSLSLAEVAGMGGGGGRRGRG